MLLAWLVNMHLAHCCTIVHVQRGHTPEEHCFVGSDCKLAPVACIAGVYPFLDPHNVELREKEAALNPVPSRSTRAGSHPVPVYCPADAEAPATKTSMYHLQAARDADTASANGIRCNQKQHPRHQTGVLGSLAVQKVPGHDDEHSCVADPMHCIGNEAYSIPGMARGGTSNPAMYSVGRLSKVAEWEVKVNHRW